ncbi:MAG: YcaO-related McrA-glycine thioamidation protein, partial [Methanomicrobiales archaeon]|nr:YcaO-related McrA-glycine thioamidation protein [Methanomicrobiales archaeon]
MQLHSCRKLYTQDTHRAFSPEETLVRISGKLSLAGITRVADITNLDRVGIPVFSSIRPSAEDGAISVYAGKGASPAEARISAMMEGIERYSAEAKDRTLLMGCYGELAGPRNMVNPRDLILPRGVDPDARIPWVEGFDIVRNETVLVPAHAVFHPLHPRFGRLFRTNTNGLASGNVLEEAVFHGLAELIERDAWSLVEATKNTGPLVRNVTDPLAAMLLEKFSAAGVEVRLRDITSDIGIPTFAAASDDLRLHDPALLTIGMGTHTSARVAVLRALTEVAQSRLTQIHGAREDTNVADFRKSIGYERAKRINRHWFSENEGIDFGDVPSFESGDFLDDIMYAIGRLHKRGLNRVVVTDLTRAEIGVPVVR